MRTKSDIYIFPLAVMVVLDSISVGDTLTAIGTGQANTTAIVNGCSTAGIAARICDDLVLNGYSDWFLPSRDELNQMYLQRAVIGVFPMHFYWSSSAESRIMAWGRLFSVDVQTSYFKGQKGSVRAIRAF